jgi:hypothetical protein
MGRRIDMHEAICSKLKELGRYPWDPFNFETDDTETLVDSIVRERVYYQPSASVKLKYPCVLYKLEDMPIIHANNLPYHWDHVYQITVIDRDPESVFREKIAELPTCRFVRPYITDNLYHFVFRAYN